MYKLEIDFALEGDAPVAEQLEAWLREHGAGVEGRLLSENGPAGGAAVIQLAAETRPALFELLKVYTGGDQTEAAWFMSQAHEG